MIESELEGAATERLYYEDPNLHRFEARVEAVRRVGDRTAVVLDRSAFYPESGGQMADHGSLADTPVVDVQVEGDTVLHFVEGDAPTVANTITGIVDSARRREHMALHTGQHILSRALLDTRNHDTVSSRLGETQCTIDLDAEQIDDAALAGAEALACAIVDADIPVEAMFPEEASLSLMSLRKRPPEKARVRVVRIGDFDTTPCGGTHCTRTAQVGLLKIVNVERHKRRVRLSFVAGARARRVLGQSDRLLRDLANGLSCGTDQVGAAIDKLRAELKATRSEAQTLGGVAAELLASSVQIADGPVILSIEGPAAVMRDVAKRLTQHDEAVCLLAAQSAEGTQVIAARGAAASFDCGAFVKRVASATGGRGGGRPDRAEGRMPPGIDWTSVARAGLDDG